jgi:hypothetical protein
MTVSVISPILLIVVAASLVIGVVVLVGAARMRSLRSYEFAVIACIAAMLPCSPSFVIGLPLGLWALMVLRRPDVKAAFRANAERRESGL